MSAITAVIYILSTFAVYAFAETDSAASVISPTGSTPASKPANRQAIRQVIGYITQWDAWQDHKAGIPGQGAYTHLNIDMHKYSILNYSSFGVAKDGSLHGGDYMHKNIYQADVMQDPAPLIMYDPYSSWEQHILFGTIDPVYYVNQEKADAAKAQGFQVSVGGDTWSQPDWKVYNAPLPMPIHKTGGEANGSAPGLLELAHQNGVKVMASVGGRSMSKHYPEMAADPVKRQNFINDCLLLLKIGFDGIDLDWEYVGPYDGMNFKGTDDDFQNYTILVKEMRAAFDKAYPSKHILISSCFSADYRKLEGFKPFVRDIDASIDYYNMMTYDMNGGWSNIAGHNSPLHDYTGSEVNAFNWDRCLQAVKEVGMPLNKVNFGVSFYGRGVICQSAAALNAPTLKRQDTVRPDGPITTCADFTNWPKDIFDGTPSYSYIKQQMSNGWTRKWDNQAKVPYMVKDNYFLSYDDVQSIQHKSQYVVENNLAGIIVRQVFGDLEFGSSTGTYYGNRLIKYPNVKHELLDAINFTTPLQYKVSGYVNPDVTYADSDADKVKSGFKVEISGTFYSTVTDTNGYFEINNLPVSTSQVNIKISKTNYLARTISRASITNNIQIGTSIAPTSVWAGDMDQNGAINMADIVKLIDTFNSAPGDGKYVEANDFNADNAINMADIITIIDHYNTTSSNYPNI
ncbi:MAG: glycosyl hydrolase family 18 protein [Clostridia bacterium]|nr:glycosyl hydrolase family 18 protein [Clostridia bacterium]